jgi:nicotinate phosphoribosyltransferase
LIETLLLNLITDGIRGFQTLIATKAARVCLAAAGDPVIEFGLRRAQGVDGGLAASRAAFLGAASPRRTCWTEKFSASPSKARTRTRG